MKALKVIGIVIVVLVVVGYLFLAPALQALAGFHFG